MIAYASDSDSMLPLGAGWTTPWPLSWDQMIIGYLETPMFGCPADRIGLTFTKTIDGVSWTGKRSYSMPGLNAGVGNPWKTKVTTWWCTSDGTCSNGLPLSRVSDSSGSALLIERWDVGNKCFNNSGAITYGPSQLASQTVQGGGHRGRDNYLFLDGHTATLTVVQGRGTGGMTAIDQAGGARGAWTLPGND